MLLPRRAATACLLVVPLAGQGTPEAPEPNHAPATAGALLPGAQAFGTIDTSGSDTDWFRFTLAQPSDLRAWTGPGLVGPIGDTQLALLDASGALIVEVDDGSQATHGYYSLLDAGPLSAGTYHLRVRGFSAAVTGSYALDLIAAPPGTYVATPPLQALAERPEINDVRLGGAATTSALYTHNVGAVVVGGGSASWSPTFAGSEDYDFYAFQVLAAGTVTLATNAGTGTAVADTVVHLVNSALARLAFDDDSGPGAYSLLTAPITQPGTYYAVVNGFAATNAGSYVLDIIGPTAPLPTGQSLVTMRSGGCAGPHGTPSVGVRGNSFGFPGHTELPLLGSTFYADVTRLPANAALFALIDLLPGAAPFDLTPLPGAPGCRVELNPATAALGVRVADGSGVCFWGLATPFRLDLVGLPLELQVAVLDPPANPLGITVSNRLSAVCGVSH